MTFQYLQPSQAARTASVSDASERARPCTRGKGLPPTDVLIQRNIPSLTNFSALVDPSIRPERFYKLSSVNSDNCVQGPIMHAQSLIGHYAVHLVLSSSCL